jgi:hypothetical protein
VNVRQRQRLACSLAVAVGLAGVTAAYADLTQTAVKAQPNPILEVTPAASTAYFAWSQNSAAHPKLSNVFVQPLAGGPAIRVNAAGTTAYGGGIAGTRLAYQEEHGRASDIRFFNLARHQHSNPPPGVNTKDWEWLPSITSQWLLFGRFRAGTSRALLYNLTTHSTRVLASVPWISKVSWAEPGQVNGDWAVYTVFHRAAPADVYVYQISARTTTKVPNPAGRWHTAAGVSDSGLVYFDESDTRACGSNATMEDWRVGGGAAQALISFTPGYDFADPFVVSSAGSDDVYYTRIRCATMGHDVYRVTSP